MAVSGICSCILRYPQVWFEFNKNFAFAAVVVAAVVVNTVNFSIPVLTLDGTKQPATTNTP